MFFFVLDERGTTVPGQPYLGWLSYDEAEAWAEDQELENYTIKETKPRLGTTLEEGNPV